ncbi:ATP-dependent 6-phosphofructokinase [Candidatus Sumerlaeota bacterium]|nr:ATP-dependent 6-phosphofructokinase [Candidatus Sumerlaeota bacterium]
MSAPKKHLSIGILTAGGDCPGLNAAIRGVAKAAIGTYGMDVVGILDGFTGLVQNRVIHLSDRELTGLLTLGGTMLGTSRDKPHRMAMPDGSTRDMTGAAVETYRRLNLDCLVCIGGDGTAKNALNLAQAGVHIVMLPKTIDNDVAETDITFGHDSARAIATEAIDRLHTTASSHSRIMVVNIMGNNAGWLALGASLAGGADVCLIPEIPYRMESVFDALRRRIAKGRRFSLVSLAEGSHPVPTKAGKRGSAAGKGKKGAKESKSAGKKGPSRATSSRKLAQQIEDELDIPTRVTTLGYVQRGGIPTPTDRLLATQMGTAATRLIVAGRFGVMVALQGGRTVPVALEEVAFKKKTVPLDHPLIEAARLIGLCLGD